MPPTVEKEKVDAASNPRLGWPLAVLALGLALTAAAGWLTYQQAERTDALRFRRLSERLTGAVSTRFENIEEAMQGARGLFAASESVERDEWAIFAANVQGFLRRGVSGFGYIERLHPADQAAFLTRMRTGGAPQFEIHPGGSRAETYAIAYIEPRDQNAPALGLDIAADDRARAAADEAMVTDRATLSQRLLLALDERRLPGFLMLLPIYGKGSRLVTPADRQRALQGWVFAAININELMEGVTGIAEEQVDFDVFDGTETTAAALVYDADQRLESHGSGPMTDADYASCRFHALVPLSMYGRQWSLIVSTRPGFGSAVRGWMMAALVGGGLAISLLAAVMVWLLLSAHSRATALAEKMTRELQAATENSRRLALVASSTKSGVVITDLEGRVEWMNEAYSRITGYTLDEMKGRKPGSILQGSETAPGVVAQMRAGLITQQGFHVVVLNYHKSGRPYWAELEVQPLRDASGAGTGFMAVQTDVTERRRIEEDLRSQESLFRFIFEHSPVGISWVRGRRGKRGLSIPRTNALRAYPRRCRRTPTTMSR